MGVLLVEKIPSPPLLTLFLYHLLIFSCPWVVYLDFSLRSWKSKCRKTYLKKNLSERRKFLKSHLDLITAKQNWFLNYCLAVIQAGLDSFAVSAQIIRLYHNVAERWEIKSFWTFEFWLTAAVKSIVAGVALIKANHRSGCVKPHPSFSGTWMKTNTLFCEIKASHLTRLLTCCCAVNRLWFIDSYPAGWTACTLTSVGCSGVLSHDSLLFDQ